MLAALFKKNLFLQILLLLHVAITFLLLLLPLTKYFSFEFASLNGFLLVVYIGLFTLREDKFKSSSIAVKVFQVKLVIFAALFLFVPIFFAFLFHLFRNDCSFLDGFKFYLVLTVPAVIIGYALGLLSAFINKKYSYFIFISLLAVLALIPVAEIYFRPQIFFYNPLIPFYPGTMYDEDIDITFTIVLYRFFNLLFFSGIIILIRKKELKTLKISKWALGSLIIIIAAGFIFLSPLLGFGSTESTLQNILQTKIETTHFTIYLPQQVNKEEQKYIAQLHEYYYERLTNFFKVKPDEKVTSFIFRTSEEKRKYFGAGNADVAKPWLKQIYVSLDSYEQSVNHELAHVFAGQWSNNLLSIDANFNPATVEGIASAADPVYDELDIHYAAFLAAKNNMGMDIQNLFSGFSFFVNVSSLSYIYSGSFCKFLIEEYGINKFKNFYRYGNFEKCYRKKLSSVVTDYQKFLNAKPYANHVHTANYYFGRQPLVQKVCPRFLANKTNDIYRLIEEKDYADAEKEILSIKDYNKNFSLFSGLIVCLEEKNPNKAETLLEKNLLYYKNTPYFYFLQLKLADEKMANGKVTEAKNILDRLALWEPTARLEARINLRRIFLAKKDDAKKFIKAKELDRFIFLIDEFKINPSSVLLLPVIDLVEKGKYDYSSFKDLVAQKNMQPGTEDWFSVLQLVRFTIKHSDFILAEQFLKILENIIPAYAAESLQNEKDKLAWFIKHEEKK